MLSVLRNARLSKVGRLKPAPFRDWTIPDTISTQLIQPRSRVLYFQNYHFVVGHAVGREAPSDMVTIDLERHAIVWRQLIFPVALTRHFCY